MYLKSVDSLVVITPAFQTKGRGFKPRYVPMCFRIFEIICTFIRRSYGEGKHREETCTHLRKISKVVCEVDQSALGQRGRLRPNLPNLGKARAPRWGHYVG